MNKVCENAQEFFSQIIKENDNSTCFECSSLKNVDFSCNFHLKMPIIQLGLLLIMEFLFVINVQDYTEVLE